MSDHAPTYVVSAARTPMGRLLGSLAPLTAAQLGGAVVKAVVDRAGVEPDAVQHVILGQVLTAGAGQLPARQAAVLGGLGMHVPALTVNKVCLSGLNAVALADHLIRAGLCDIVVAGGMESMSRAPHLLPSSRTGTRYGGVELVDHLAHDGLADAYTEQPMGALTEAHNTGDAYCSREDQDAFAARSHRRAAAAWEAGEFADEVVPVSVPQRRGDPVSVDRDEGLRADTTVERLAALRPAFAPDGTITAGSASPISDGAAAVLVMSADAVERTGCTPLARIGAYAQVAGPDSSLQYQPAAAIRAAADRAGLDPAGFDRYEINEAFAAVALASTRALGLDADQTDARVNVHGGAIALGHPIGMSGARLVAHLALQISRGHAGHAVAALCGGGGQGDALVLGRA